MSKQQNAILDKICEYLEKTNWITTNQELKNLGYYTVNIQFNATEFYLHQHEMIAELSEKLMHAIQEKFWQNAPIRYRPAHGLNQLDILLGMYCRPDLYSYLIIGPETRDKLRNTTVQSMITISNGELALNKVKINTLKQFDGGNNNPRVILLNSPIEIIFQTFKYDADNLTIGFSLKMPQDHLIIELCKE